MSLYLTNKDRSVLDQRARNGDLQAEIYSDLMFHINTLYRMIEMLKNGTPGPPGPPGPSGSANLETPSGPVDGVNTTFTTSAPYASLAVFWDGALQNGFMTITYTSPSTGVFTLSVAPPSGTVVKVLY